MNFLLALTNAANPKVITQTNFERLDGSLAFMLQPTKVNGVANALIGPPTANAHVQHELWVDSLGAVHRCTVAGTPGTWVQISPAVQSDAPAGTIPTGYLWMDIDTGVLNRYNGASFDALY